MFNSKELEPYLKKKKSTLWIECIGPKGQRERLSPNVANIVVNLWGYDLLQQWNTQVNIPATSKTYLSGEDIRRYRQRSPAIQAIQEHKGIDKPLEILTALPLKWLTEKPI